MHKFIREVLVMNPAQVSGTRVQKQLDSVTQVATARSNDNAEQNAVRMALATPSPTHPRGNGSPEDYVIKRRMATARCTEVVKV